MEWCFDTLMKGKLCMADLALISCERICPACRLVRLLQIYECIHAGARSPTAGWLWAELVRTCDVQAGCQWPIACSTSCSVGEWLQPAAADDDDGSRWRVVPSLAVVYAQRIAYYTISHWYLALCHYSSALSKDIVYTSLL